MNLHFITNVQLKNIIGKDLINNDNIAILELVKNAFDANAKRTDISFVNLVNVILLVFILLYTNKIAVIAPCKRNRIETKSVF